MGSDTTEVGRKLARERREEIAKHLTQLRSVLKDLETHGVPHDVPFEERLAYSNALEEAKKRIHELDLEFIKLS